MKFNSKEELQTAIKGFKEKQAKTAKRVQEILNSSPTLLGPDGNPTMSSMKAIDDQMRNLFFNFLSKPTLREAESFPALGENSSEGSSFSVSFLSGIMILGSVAQMAPMLQQVAPQMLMFFLSESNSESGLSPESFVEKVRGNITLKATDEQGHVILESDESLGVVEQLNAVTSAFILILSNMGLVELDEEEGLVQLNEKGKRLLQHLVSANDWVMSVHQAMLQFPAQLPL